MRKRVLSHTVDQRKWVRASIHDTI